MRVVLIGCRSAFVYRVIHGDGGKLGKQPPFLRWRLSDPVQRVWLQFCSASAAVPVHTLRVRDIPFASRICTLCTEGVVGDEQHVLLTCRATASVRLLHAQHLRFDYSNLHDFLKENRASALAYFVWDVMRKLS